MEMYALPEFRRKNYGTNIYEHAKEMLLKDGAVKAYLTPDSNSGVPFWINVEFTDSENLIMIIKCQFILKNCNRICTIRA